MRRSRRRREHVSKRWKERGLDRDPGAGGLRGDESCKAPMV